MRGVSKGVVRGLIGVSLVMVLAVPAQARPGDGSWLEEGRGRIIKVIKKIVKSLGDGLIDPRP
jgi:hypothetical protein